MRDGIERLFGSWARFACRHALAVTLAMLAFSALLVVRIPSLVVDNSTESFLRPDDPARVAYDDFRDRFGRDERITLAVEAPDLFAEDFLERLRRLHEELEAEVPHIAELSSLLNARSTRGEGDRLVVEELFEEWPASEAERERLRRRALENPLLENTLISRDGRVTLLSIELVTWAPAQGVDLTGGFDDAGEDGASDDERDYLPEPAIAEAVRRAREVAARHDGPGFRVLLAGAPVMSERLNTRMQQDMGVFTLACFAAIALFLYLLFQRTSAVLLPLLVVGLSMLATLGVMAWVGAPLSVATQILPSFLLAVGVCDAVHVLAIFYQSLEAGDGREQAIVHTMEHSGLAIVMTSLTTAGGLASFAAGDLKPVADLGVFAPFGVMFALVYTVVLLPALLSLTPSRPPRPSSAARDAVTRVLEAVGDFAATHPWGVVSVSAALLLVSGLGISFLRFSHDPLDWLPESEPLLQSTRFMNDRLDGVNVVEVVVDTGVPGGVKEPDLLRRLDRVREENARIHQGVWHVGKTLSVADVVKEIHRALNEDRADHYAIPDDRRLVAQELLLFENSGSDDLSDFVDPLFQQARVTLRVPWMDAVAYPKALADLERRLRGVLGEDVGIEVTGLVPVLSRTFRAMLESMARSYVLAVLVILPLMVLLIGDLWRGLLSMVPNLTPVFATLGFMGWAQLPVDGLTMMIGAVVIGLAVDDTIHFMHNFRRSYERSGDARLAIRQTLQTTGRALLVTSVVLAAGFFTFVGAYMENIALFGALCGGAILLAFVSNVLLASSLMVLATGQGWRAGVVAGVQVAGRPADEPGMDEAGAVEEVQVSPEEERFLKRFFRRQALPWVAAGVVLSVAAAWALKGDGDSSALESRTSAAIAQMRSENQRLAAEVEKLRDALAERSTAGSGEADELEHRVEQARRNVAMIESRVAARLERRIAELEGQLASGAVAAAPSAAAPPPDASAWDVSTILDRLYALEQRQGDTGGAGGGDRLASLERRLARLEGGPSLPAAPSP